MGWKPWPLRVILLLSLPVALLGQSGAGEKDAVDLRATDRVALEVDFIVGPVHRDGQGRYYVPDRHERLVRVYDNRFNPVGTIGGPSPGVAALNPDNFAVTRDGRVVSAELTQIKVFSPAGVLQGSFPVWRVTTLGVLRTGEIVVSGFGAQKLISIYDVEGQLLRSFGQPVHADDDSHRNAMLNVGRIVTDSKDNIYYLFLFLPEPTIRKYDREGNLLAELHPDGKMIRKAATLAEEKLEKQRAGEGTGFSAVFEGIAVDEESEELWVSWASYIYRLGPDGAVRAVYQFKRPENFPVNVNHMLVERDRLIIASTAHGVFLAPKPAAR